jgi:hypothetical protein
VRAIAESAFMSSPFPVFIFLEMHTCAEQTAVAAWLLRVPINYLACRNPKHRPNPAYLTIQPAKSRLHF